jgi:PKD repeat protein
MTIKLKNFKSANIIKSMFLAFVIVFLSNNINAQYCTSGATNTTDEFISNVRLVQGSNVLLDNNTFQPATTVCATYTDFTSLPSIPMSAGATYTVSVRVGYCGTGVFQNQALVWIDYNRNNNFEASEAVRSTPFAAAAGVRDINYTFTVPCNVNPGITRMRCVLIETTVMTNPGNACGTYTWGETEDYRINLQLPTNLSSGFAAPTKAWVKSVVRFVNSNQTGYISHTWDANNDGTIEAPNSVNFNFTWNTGGTKCVKLRSTNCAGSDSIVKCLTIDTPTVVPDANFVADKVLVEQYEPMKIFDLSEYGPYQWSWEVYDSTDVNDVKNIASGDVFTDPLANGSNQNTQNPEFSFDRPGCYTVVLTARNDRGFSIPKRKVCYITVTLPTQYLLGFGSYGPNSDNVVQSATGTIFDNGGRFLNYSNNQGLGSRSFIRITPCNAQKINLTMTQLRFAGTGDRLRVWDGKAPGGANTTLLANWTAGQTTPRNVSATSGSMYILFESDASGVDSGFAGFYNSELGPATVSSPSFSPSIPVGFNNTPIKFSNTSQNVIGVPSWEWTIDNDIVSTSENLNYTFTTDQTYKVCLEVKSCVGNSKTCMNYDVITPNTQTSLSIKASNRRPNVGVDRVVLTPVVDNANRFEWTIFPTTYTLLNPPSGGGSSHGAGFVRYNSNPGDTFPTPIIRFNTSGCYTVTLKAWNNNNPTTTTKTVAINRFICAVEYCAPAAFIKSSDLAINRVILSDGNTPLIDKSVTSSSGTYNNYSATDIANLTYGKTYTLEVRRSSNVDPANRKAWIDWNIDGDFDDLGEEIFFEPSTRNQVYTTTFTVPSLTASFEGLSRLRIAINYENQNTTSCGPLAAGEYHDYGINLAKDNSKPIITMLGNEVVRIEVGSSYTDAGATAFDASEGDITSRMTTVNDLDVNLTGIYNYEYNVTDLSGNIAETKVRTVIVVNDITPPTINLNPGSTSCIEAKRDNAPYIDPGATAFNTNPFYSLTSAIRVSGNVDTRTIGNYTLTYTVFDFDGNIATATRNVCVEDTKAPVINANGERNIQINSLWIDQTFVEDDYDNDPMLTKTWFPEPLNSQLKGTYTATYTAKDQEGNMSAPIVVDYRVDDFIAPVINLNTFDVVEHDVTTPYVSVTASVSDNYYGSGQVSVSRISSNVNPYLLGTYTEVFKAVDGSGNVATKTRTVKVVDRQAPTLWGGTIYGCVGENIWPMWGLSSTDNYYGPQILLPLVEIVSQNVNPFQEGSYYITYKVTDLSGNTSALLTRQVVYTYWPACLNSTVGVNANKKVEESVIIYPNPSNGMVNISFDGSVINQANLKVVNQMGQVVLENNINEPTSSINLDLSNFAKGVYTINIISDGIIVTKKVTLIK